jgi:spore germination cell wall hydrolase CwlJ-like protein
VAGAKTVARAVAQESWLLLGWVSVAPLILAHRAFDLPPALPHDPALPEAWPVPPIETVIAPEDLQCLALNLYHEARGEPELGRIAVGQVVLNRAADGDFPGTLCAVVHQGGATTLNRCQFSWWCDGKSDRPNSEEDWADSQRLAAELARGWHGDPTGGALWYHADYVSPSWRQAFVQGPQIGRHIFYRRPRTHGFWPDFGFFGDEKS